MPELLQGSPPALTHEESLEHLKGPLLQRLSVFLGASRRSEQRLLRGRGEGGGGPPLQPGSRFDGGSESHFLWAAFETAFQSKTRGQDGFARSAPC